MPDSATATASSGIERAQPGEHASVHRQGLEVARVDADDPCPGVDRAPGLVLVVDLDQGGEAQLLGQLAKRDEVALPERGDDEQDEVGTERPGLEHLVGLDGEVLAQHRDRDAVPDRFKVGQAPREAARLGEDADRGGAARGILRGQRGGVADGRKRSLAGAGPLDLSDDGDARRRAQGRLGVEGRGLRGDPCLQVGRRRRALPVGEVDADTGDDVVQDGGHVLKATGGLDRKPNGAKGLLPVR